MHSHSDIIISSQFDSGNIEVIASHDPQDIRLRIRRDSACDFMQWFHFRLHGVANTALTITIENAGECSYADGWHDYQCAASYDRADWFRISNTTYDGSALRIQITPQRDTVWLAYFEPYSYERHLDLIGRCARHQDVSVQRIGASALGRDLDLVRVGAADAGRPNIWINARQHPGESMSEWSAEGLLDRLLDPNDAIAREIRQRACVHVVPNINPDGAMLGNLRANARGVNLNRAWGEPSLVHSPEIFHLQAALHDSPPALFIDLHGDETLPYVFIDGSHMVPGYGERNLALQAQFLDQLKLACPDFQTDEGYADNRFDEELLTLASKWVAHSFGCVSLTLEMPFKDNINAPDPRHGWNGARSRQLGAALLQPILLHLRSLAA